MEREIKRNQKDTIMTGGEDEAGPTASYRPPLSWFFKLVVTVQIMPNDSRSYLQLH